jgi:hypothetical protein
MQLHLADCSYSVCGCSWPQTSEDITKKKQSPNTTLFVVNFEVNQTHEGDLERLFRK